MITPTPPRVYFGIQSVEPVGPHGSGQAWIAESKRGRCFITLVPMPYFDDGIYSLSFAWVNGKHGQAFVGCDASHTPTTHEF